MSEPFTCSPSQDDANVFMFCCLVEFGFGDGQCTCNIFLKFGFGDGQCTCNIFLKFGFGDGQCTCNIILKQVLWLIGKLSRK